MLDTRYQWTLDAQIFHAINDLHGTWYDWVMLLGTQLGSRVNFPVYLLLLGGFFWLSSRKNRSGEQGVTYIEQKFLMVIAVFVIAFMVDMLVIEVLKLWLHRPRPFMVFPLETMRMFGPQLAEREFYHSFPSGHASFAGVIVASLWPILSRSARLVGCVFVLWVGWSRIALGVHFPADVVVGVLISVILTAIIRHAVKHYRHPAVV